MSTAVLEEEEMEEEEEPGRVGERSGCAVSDSYELVRSMVVVCPCALLLSEARV